jgi:hypothetical protein
MPDADWKMIAIPIYGEATHLHFRAFLLLTYRQSPQKLQQLQRQVRYGSIYNRATATFRFGPGYCNDVNNDDDGDNETSAAGGDGGSTQLPGRSGVETNRQTATREAAAAGWRSGAGLSAIRRKRYSLPSIRLYSSLDSPGAGFSGGSAKTNHATGGEQQATVAEDESSTGNGSDRAVAGAFPDKLAHVHTALAARRSRELMRADTEILPPTSMYDEST